MRYLQTIVVVGRWIFLVLEKCDDADVRDLRCFNVAHVGFYHELERSIDSKSHDSSWESADYSKMNR